MRYVSVATVLVLIGCAGLEPGDAQAAVICEGEDCVATEIGDDTFVAGGEVRIDAQLPGDALIAGGQVVVRGAIAGDVAAAGGTVDLVSTIRDDLYAAGGQIDLDGSVGGNARLAGGEIRLGPGSRIDGGVSLGAGRVELDGSIGGYVQGGAGELVINGVIEGDVDVGTGELTLGPQARIGGSLRYRSPDEARIDSGAQIAGGIERLPADDDWSFHGPGLLRPLARVAGFVWLAGAALLGVLVLLTAPEFTARSTRVVRHEVGLATLVGFAFLVAVPVAAVLLMITVLGIPLGIALVLGYSVALFVGWLFAVIAIGDTVLATTARDASSRPGARVVAFLGAFIAIAVLAQLPWLGGLVRLAIVVLGTGALVLALWRARHGETVAVGA